jgi:hypothetical protein
MTRGSGKTREIGLLALLATRLTGTGTRLVILIADRRDLEVSLYEVADAIFKANRAEQVRGGSQCHILEELCMVPHRGAWSFICPTPCGTRAHTSSACSHPSGNFRARFFRLSWPWGVSQQRWPRRRRQLRRARQFQVGKSGVPHQEFRSLLGNYILAS